LPFADHLECEIIGAKLVFPRSVMDQGLKELMLLARIFGPISDEKGEYPYARKAWSGQTRVWEMALHRYLKARDLMFGPGEAFSAYVAKVRAELDSTKGLRDTVEPPLHDEGNKKAPSRARREPDWKEAQDVFYAWVRRPMEELVGSDVDIGALIMRGVTARLKAALAQVEASYGRFSYGSINPRPKKKDGFGYRLGSLSDHALGNAIDINARQNPQVNPERWAHIVKYVNLPMTKAARASTWKTKPKSLYDYIHQVSDTFAKKLREAVEKAAKGPPHLDEHKALAAVVKHDSHLSGIGLEFTGKYHKGFFNLPWDLVHELHQAKFVWGATFDTVDLHHFDFGSGGSP